MNAGPQDFSLDAIRKEIDGIDDALLALVGQRFRASAKVRQVKAADGGLAASPIRPGREAIILRRLMAARPPEVSPDALVRLWRIVLTSSTLAQASVTVHLPAAVNDTPQLRAAVTLQFGATPVAVHADAPAAVAKIMAARSDIAVVTPRSSWAGAVLGAADAPHVMSTLPSLSTGGEPQLLVLGYPPVQETGDDQSLLIGSQAWSGPQTPLWQTLAGPLRLVCLPGFIDEARFARDIAPQGWRLAGRFPAPLKVSP